MDNQLNATKDLIFRDFDMEAVEDQLTEEELFDILADQIAYMIEYRIDFLLSLMYRLDVLEPKINKALSPNAPEPANVGLARLVLERQKERIRTKQTYKSKDDGTLDDFNL